MQPTLASLLLPAACPDALKGEGENTGHPRPLIWNPIVWSWASQALPFPARAWGSSLLSLPNVSALPRHRKAPLCLSSSYQCPLSHHSSRGAFADAGTGCPLTALKGFTYSSKAGWPCSFPVEAPSGPSKLFRCPQVYSKNSSSKKYIVWHKQWLFLL